MGPRAKRVLTKRGAAKHMAYASSAVAKPCRERPIAMEVKGYVRQTTLRYAAWPKDETCCTVENKTHYI